MFEYLLTKWDWWIYYRAFHSMRRMCRRNPGFAYIMELHIANWREQNPIEPERMKIAKDFYEAMMLDYQLRLDCAEHFRRERARGK